jgi:NAD(P)H-flavin reductase
MKSFMSPPAFLFRTSHEQLNPYHRFLGRIIYSFLVLHGVLYFNFFYHNGLISQKLGERITLVGIVALLMLTLLSTTAFARVRRWSYRVFFVCHLVIGFTILPLLFFHASHLRYYVVEALLLFIIDLTARKLSTFSAFSRISSVPHTNLIRVDVPVPASKLSYFSAHAGQHVYLSLPPQSISKESASPIHDLLYNPFTISSTIAEPPSLTLVLRHLNGPTTNALSQLIALPKARPPINIEGPYGATKHFPDLAKFDRVLLVAGGVGATFLLPIYQQLQANMQEYGTNKVQLIWSMRSAAEASWVEDIQTLGTTGSVQLFVTRAEGSSLAELQRPIPDEGSVELNELRKEEEPVTVENRGRPDLNAIVDDTFRQGSEEKVAVLVCGPSNMARELRSAVGKWVAQGRDVWFFNEGFGW